MCVCVFQVGGKAFSAGSDPYTKLDELITHLNFDDTKTVGFNFWLLFNVKNVYNFVLSHVSYNIIDRDSFQGMCSSWTDLIFKNFRDQ